MNALSLDPTGRIWAAGESGISVFDGSEWTLPPFRRGIEEAPFSFDTP